MEVTIQELIKNRSEELFNKVVGYREHLHQFPELSYQEFNTMNYVSEVLTAIGIEHEKEVGKTGIVALIKKPNHSNSEPCIALRADLDALPIKEENVVPYASKIPGVMHACGHDVHTAVLLGAAELIHDFREKLSCSVKIIFQPGEEKNPGGATLMIAANVLNNPPVKEIYALHVFPDLEVGKVGFKEGIYMASCDEIHLTIIGKGGHGATPHDCVDPIAIGATIISNLQQIVSRNCDPKIPCVITFGHFEALGSTNVIPSKAILKGTFRTMDENWRTKAIDLIHRQIYAIAESMGAKVELEISKGYPVLFNDPKITKKAADKAKSFLGNENICNLPIRLSSEDFAFYAQEIPACFFRLGVRNEQKGIIYGVHNPKFDIDTDALKIGVSMMALMAFDS